MGKDDNGFAFIIVSYVPLLVGDPIATFDPEDAVELSRHIDALPDGAADGCVWLTDDGAPCPVFIMPMAEVIASHFDAWSEGAPAEWFDLCIKSRDEKYAMVLMPRFQKSIERFGVAYQLRTGYPVPPDSHHNIIFKPLRFSTGSSATFGGMRDLIGPKMPLFLMDPADLHPTDLSKSDFSKVHKLGTFHVSSDEVMLAYLDDLLDKAEKPSSSPFDRYRSG